MAMRQCSEFDIPMNFKDVLMVLPFTGSIHLLGVFRALGEDIRSNEVTSVTIIESDQFQKTMQPHVVKQLLDMRSIYRSGRMPFWNQPL